MERPVIYYVFDVLCSWCYGFSANIQKLQEEYKDRIDFRVMSGGMVIGDREGPIGDLPPEIVNTFKRIEEMSGQPFSPEFYALQEKGEAFLSSLPGALALAAFRTYQPDNALQFAGRMQKAFYQEGLEPASAKTYGHCAEDFGMNAEDFMKLMVDKDRLELVNEEFAIVRKWGISGFPAVIFQDKDKAYLIARGYQDYESLEKNLLDLFTP
tara:strand:- start:8621 stop:9253 length:633 start_codon:yes stop_codon:yes gene_type:complete